MGKILMKMAVLLKGNTLRMKHENEKQLYNLKAQRTIIF